MTCYDEFPASTVFYNWITAGGTLALGAAVAMQFGAVALGGYILLLAVSLGGILATACSRCAGYYGRRCGLGLGTLVARLFRQKETGRYLRTPEQFIFVMLFLAAMLWPVAGSALLLSRSSGAWPLAQLIAAGALLLAFAVPHPTLVCRHCKQGACGACPVGKRFHTEG